MHVGEVATARKSTMLQYEMIMIFMTIEKLGYDMENLRKIETAGTSFTVIAYPCT